MPAAEATATARPWLGVAVRCLLALALGLLAAFVIASHALERFLVAEASADLQRIERGASRLSFEFESLRDLISEGAVGAEEVALADGVVHARLPDGRANLRLNLRGLTLDARRFTQVQLRIEASHACELLLIFDEPGQLEEWSAALPLSPGWNDIALELTELPWVRSADRVAGRVSTAQAWGGSSGRVGEMRLYLAGPPQLIIGLDHVRLLENAAARVREPIVWLSADDALTRMQREVPIAPATHAGVLLPVWQARPEVLLSLRDGLRARDAESLFWPAGRALPTATDTAVGALAGWTVPAWVLTLYVLILVLARWRLDADTPTGAGIDLVLGLGPLVALTAGLGLGERPTPSALTLLLLALAYMYSRVERQTFTVDRKAGARAGRPDNGAALAWRDALLMTAGIALAIGLTALVSAQPPRPDGERALLYLPFVVLQQLLLLGFLLPRARTLMPTAPAAFAAVLFALPHAPNFALMVGSGFVAWLWSRLFLRYQAPFPILVSHYLLGLAAVFCLPPEVLFSAESSLRFFVVR